MNKIEKIVLALAIIISILSVVIQLAISDKPIGNIFVESNAYSAAPTYASTTITNNLATSLIPRAASSRNIARICHRDDSANNVAVFIFKQATSTGVAVVGGGFPIYSSSTSAGQNCFMVGINDPYLGEIWGISSATTSVTIEYLQN